MFLLFYFRVVNIRLDRFDRHERLERLEHYVRFILSISAQFFSLRSAVNSLLSALSIYLP